MCYSIAMENGGTVTELNTDTSPTNFYSTQIRRHDNFILFCRTSIIPMRPLLSGMIPADLFWPVSQSGSDCRRGRCISWALPSWIRTGTTCAENSVRKNWSRSAIGNRKQSEKSYLTLGIDVVDEELVLTWICGAKDCFPEKIFTAPVRCAANVFTLQLCGADGACWPRRHWPCRES